MTSQCINEGTLKKVKDSNGSFDKYRQLHGEMLKYVNTGKGRPKKDEQPVQTVNHQIMITANHYMMEQLQEQTKLIKLISNKLAVIVEDLYGAKGVNQ